MMRLQELLTPECVAKAIYVFLAAQIGMSAVPDKTDVVLARLEERIIAIDQRLTKIELRQNRDDR